jgi:hypothetical protein
MAVSQFRVLRNAPDLSHKVVRRIRLALYCALAARRVDLVESGDLEGSSLDSKSVVSWALVECVWTHIRGFDPTHQNKNKDAKEIRILFTIRG